MNTSRKRMQKDFFKRLGSKNFWYDAALRTTIWNTIKQMTDFNKTEIISMKQTYAKLRKSNACLVDGIPSEYHISWCSIVLSIYMVSLSKGISPTEAMDQIERILFTNMKAQSVSKHIESALDRSKDPYSYIVKASKKQEKSFFGSTFVFDRKIDNENAYLLVVKKCLYYDYFKSNNAPELMRIACKWDMVSWTRGIVPEKHKVIFQRSATIGLDGKDCEFHFDRLEKQRF